MSREPAFASLRSAHEGQRLETQRHLVALPLRQHEDWNVKPYLLSPDGTPLEAAMLAQTTCIVDGVLTDDAAQDRHHGHAFSILHHTRSVDFLSVCWWVNGNELRLCLFLRSTGEKFSAAPSGHSVACLWELEVIAHEARAWYQAMIAFPPAEPLRYLRERIEGWMPDIAGYCSPEEGSTAAIT